MNTNASAGEQDNVINLIEKAGEARVDSTTLAHELQATHRFIFRLIEKYASDFEEFGVLRFQNAKPAKGSVGGRPVRYALLNEDQAYLLLTYSKNTPRARRLKIRLVKSFRRFREGRQSQHDYLPFYHDLHAEVQRLAHVAQENGSKTAEQFFHINVNKLINKTFSIEPGKRSKLTPNERLALTSGNVIVRNALAEAMEAGMGHKAAYVHAKEQLERYAKAMTPALFGSNVAKEAA